jgi:predicted acylesterase/phospholipase RssA
VLLVESGEEVEALIDRVHIEWKGDMSACALSFHQRKALLGGITVRPDVPPGTPMPRTWMTKLRPLHRMYSRDLRLEDVQDVLPTKSSLTWTPTDYSSGVMELNGRGSGLWLAVRVPLPKHFSRLSDETLAALAADVVTLRDIVLRP